MRVIAGEFRSRKVATLHGADVRPTPDRLRETLFNILQPEIKGAVFVDAYAGSGAVGIEALSRGAREAVFLESHRDAVEVIRRNLASLGIEGRARVMKGSAVSLIANISAALLAERAEELAGATRGHGALILSGFLVEGLASVRAAYAAVGDIDVRVEGE